MKLLFKSVIACSTTATPPPHGKTSTAPIGLLGSRPPLGGLCQPNWRLRLHFWFPRGLSPKDYKYLIRLNSALEIHFKGDSPVLIGTICITVCMYKLVDLNHINISISFKSPNKKCMQYFSGQWSIINKLLYNMFVNSTSQATPVHTLYKSCKNKI